MKNLIVHFIFLVIFFIACISASDEWIQFKIKFNKGYESIQEDAMRHKLFDDSRTYVDSHNRLYAKGNFSYKLAINFFADRNDTEYLQMKGFKYSHRLRESTLFYHVPKNISLAKEFDWIKMGAISSVKNQKNCGSSWAFSAVGVIEGQNFLKTKQMVSLSVQNLIDCVNNSYDSYGCYRGEPLGALAYVRDVGGIEAEKSYFYEATFMNCVYNPKNSRANNQAFIRVRKSEEELKAVVAIKGPISVAIDARHQSFKYYEKGIYDNPECSSSEDDLDHAVLLTGYGIENGVEYWLIKNSWGINWGINGYMKIARNKNNMCGIASAAVFSLT